MALGYRREAIARYYASHQPRGLSLRYSVETEPLGTGGALRNLRSMLAGEEFLVMNGDSIFDVDLRKMFSFHRRHRAEATLALAHPPETARYGSVVLDARKRIKAFLEKQAPLPEGSNGSVRARWISGGLYIMNKSVFRCMPRRQEVSLEKEVFPRLIGRRFYGFPWEGYFIDIGIPEDYRKARAELPERFSSC
ncbi:MAG: sugar phosphate nucleotidyltransferase [Acidobacteria bacterium]|nr:sugar phosphate nucleotidyltransferase [Acidobacteriota bacterium]